MPEPGPEPPEPTCPRCGAPHDPYQEYCLGCGARLPATYAAQREIPSRETSPTWLWAALVALLLVALVAGAIVAVAATDDEEERPGAAVEGPAGSGTGGIDVITGTETLTIPPPTVTVPTDTTTQPPTPPAGGGPIEWPAGQTGFTIVLASVPTDAGRAPAETTADEAIAAGLAQVGILASDDYSSLRPGYVVVFSGVYTTIEEAQGALEAARSSGYPLAYVRQIAP